MITRFVTLSAANGQPDFEVRELLWTTAHPASHYGLGVLLLPEDGKACAGEILDGDTFRVWRDTWGSRIDTDEVALICGALGVPVGEPGIHLVCE